MKTSVRVQLDKESSAAIEEFQRRLGMTPSEVVREEIRLLHQQGAASRPGLIGVGKSNLGITDLSTNPLHMQGFGQ